jgi:DNA polymerase elongation subunit (family B)
MTNYIGAAIDYDSDEVLVWERTSKEQRVLKRIPAPRYFYVPAEDGTYTSLYGESLERIDCENKEEFEALCKQYRNKHESDIQPLFKVLMNKYYQKPLPILNFAFVDIETDVKLSSWDLNSLVKIKTDDVLSEISIKKLRELPSSILKKTKIWHKRMSIWHRAEFCLELRDGCGFGGTSNPYAAINAVTIYQSWSDKYLTYVLAPKGYDRTNFEKDIKIAAAEANFDIDTNITICSNEVELLMCLVESIQNSDIVSGWNSEFFDLPYIMKRLERVTPKIAPKMSFIGARKPKETMTEKFGEPQITYKLSGRTHLDYMDLFKKFAQDAKYPSYSLGFVGEQEVNVPKVHFDGTFEEFYNYEFPKFVVYNIRDVDILVKINKKRKLMSLINQMAHDSTCLFENLLGTVRYIETAMVNRAHNIHNVIVRDKNGLTSDGEVVDGALVLDPVQGLHEWLGSVDINSLYPSVIRSLNISPEMIVGTFISGNCSSELKSNGSRFVPINNSTLPEWKQNHIRKNFATQKSVLSGTVTSGEYDWAGIIEGDSLEHTLELSPEQADILGESHLSATGAEWLQIFKDQKWAISAYGTVFDQSRGLGLIPKTLEAWYSERKALQAEKKKYQIELKEFEKILGSKQRTEEDLIKIQELNDKIEDFELRQMSKKLSLNSSYGAMLSPHFGLGKKELGASVTSCGRAITKHMIETTAEEILKKKAQITWYHGQGKKDKTGSLFNAKRTACFIPDDQSISQVTLLSDTDSVVGSTIIETSIGRMPVEDFFNAQPQIDIIEDKREFGSGSDITALGFKDNKAVQLDVRYVYRHKTKKQKWKVTLESGKSIIITEDHSLMIMRDGKMIEIKPSQINTDTDTCICKKE